MIMFTVLNAFIRKKVFKKVNHTTERIRKRIAQYNQRKNKEENSRHQQRS